MVWLNGNRMRLVVIGIVAVMIIGGSNVKADFTFGEPTNLGPTINTESADGSPCISADGLELYFSTDHESGYGSDDLWVCTRTTTEDTWGPPQNLGPVVNSSIGEWYPSISVDGLELYFELWDQGPDTALTFSIWVTRRTTKSDEWMQPEKVDLAVPDGYLAGDPSLSTDGLELYFISANPTEAKSNLCVAKRQTKDSPWTESVNLGLAVNFETNQVGPRISADGLVLLSHDWWKCSPRPGGLGLWDIWLTRRATTDSEWEPPVNVGLPINTAFRDTGAVFSPDGSMLYFSSDRFGGSGWYDLWQAPILPVVDFDGDGNVTLSDLMLMVDSWGTNNARCDIGPMPWGDGVVDAADLDVLMASWGQAVEFPYDPGKASNPMPANGSTTMDEDISLSWTPGRKVAQHDVYLGTDSVAVKDADISDTSGIYQGRQDTSDYTPPVELEFGKTFFWRIDEVDTDGNVIKGKLWSFTIADVVDNFEQYNDDTDAGTAIWQTWWDGWGVPANGSVVGYAYAPFAELEIVHGGYQSMPFYYDNSLALSSEATRFWEEPQDWTRRGVKRLSLWIHGQADNNTEPPYVALGDSSGNYATVMKNDPVMTTVEEWQQWSIDLTAFTGVSADAITDMTFGVGDKTDTQPGGTGTIFVDDIELHLP